MTFYELAAVYFAVATAIFIEGEFALITSAFAARLGYLNYSLIFIIGYISTIAYDWIWFLIGRWKGRSLVDAREGLQKFRVKIASFLEKRQTLLVLSYRYLYGLRGVICLLIGLSDIKTKKFILLSLLTTFLWTLFYSGLGYFFGKFLETKLSNIQNSGPFILLALAILGIILYSLTTFITGKKFSRRRSS